MIMQNKPNVKDAHINVNSYMKSKYEKLDTWLSGKNKPNSNPIKPNLRKAKMNVNSLAKKSGHTFQQNKKKSGQSRMKWLELVFWINCQFQIYVN